MKVFIDTNIYLTFYHYTNEDFEELKKLLVAIENGNIDLQLTDQVIFEFRRNRESKISDALKKFRDQKLSDQFPQICKGYPEYKDLRKAIKKYEESKDEILKKLSADIEQNNLHADRIINELFNSVTPIETTEDIIRKARLRIELGNPPRKSGSLGDAINWEILLKNVPSGEDIYIISGDRDYVSRINENALSEFLAEEWKRVKKSEIYFYPNLSGFFRDKFPHIKLASELEKELAISNLISSGNFQSTHKAISNLSKYADFTDQQINDMIEAAITNNQIYWIKDDEDVKTFFDNLLKNKEHVVDREKLRKFYSIFRSNKSDDIVVTGEDIPF